MHKLRTSLIGRYLFCYWIALFPILQPMLAPSVVYAAEEKKIEEANDGQSLGASLLWNNQIPTLNEGSSTGETSQYYDNFGNDDQRVKNEVWLHDFVPGYDPANPDAGRAELEGYESDTIGLYNNGVINQSNLANGTDEQSLAFQTLQDAAANPENAIYRNRDFLNDPMFDSLPAIMDGTHPEWEGLTSGCVTTYYEEETEDDEVLLGETRVCSQVAVPQPGLCDITREVLLEPVETKVIFSFEIPDTQFKKCNAECGFESFSECEYQENYCDGWCEYENGQGGHQVRCSEECDMGCGFYSNGEWEQQNGHLNCYQVDQNENPVWGPGGEGDYIECDETAGGDFPPVTGVQNESYDALGSTAIIETIETIGSTEDVPVSRTAFDPPSLGLLPNEYIIGNYQIQSFSGDDATITVNTMGELSDNWHFDYDLNMTNVTAIEVTATIYRYAVNDQVQNPDCDGFVGDALIDGYCTGGMSCIDYTPCRMVDIDEDGDGEPDSQIEYCDTGAPFGFDDSLQEWNIDPDVTIDQMCWSVSTSINTCEPYTTCTGDECTCDGLTEQELEDCEAMSCWLDIDGNEVCVDGVVNDWENNLGDPGWVDSCEAQLADPTCTLSEAERQCNLNGEGDITGRCYTRDVIFECGEVVVIDRPPNTDESLLCAGDIPCMGTECHNVASEDNNSFSDALLAVSVIDASEGSMECADPEDPSTCILFPGKKEQCKDPRDSSDWLVPDCCEMARQAAMPESELGLYIKLAYAFTAFAKHELTHTWLANSSVYSGFAQMFQPLTEAYNAAAAALTTAWNGAMQAIGADVLTITLSDEVKQGVWSGVQQLLGQMIYDILPDALANSIFQASSEGVVEGLAQDGLGEIIGGIYNFLVWVYYIYLIYQIVKIIVSMIDGFKCEEEELGFGNSLVHHACHYIGSKCVKKWGVFQKCIIDARVYCCYQSPLGRIINEQIKGASVPSNQRSEYRGEAEWGTVDEPRCDGLTVDEIQNANWDDVDLSEWEAILTEAGIMPDANSFDVPRPWINRLGESDENTYSDSVDANANRLNDAAADLESNYWELFNDGPQGFSKTLKV